MAVPPLHHGALDARDERVGLHPGQRHRDVDVVADVEDRDGQDERHEEPVGDVDVRLLAGHHRADELDGVEDPDDRQVEVENPLRLSIFLALGVAEHVAERRQDDEDVVVPEDELREALAAEQILAAGALHGVERGGEQDVAAKREDNGRGVDRPQAPEARPLKAEIQRRKSELQRDEDAGQEADDTPEHCSDDEESDGVFVITHIFRHPLAAQGGPWRQSR